MKIMSIEIKAWFSDWKEASPEQAQSFVNHLISGMAGVSFDKKVHVIETCHLRGGTMQNLFGDDAR